jgi:hypothetical protein
MIEAMVSLAILALFMIVTITVGTWWAKRAIRVHRLEQSRGLAQSLLGWTLSDSPLPLGNQYGWTDGQRWTIVVEPCSPPAEGNDGVFTPLGIGAPQPWQVRVIVWWPGSRPRISVELRSIKIDSAEPRPECLQSSDHLAHLEDG